MIFKTIDGDLKVFNKTIIATKDNLKSLETVNNTVYNKNGAFNLESLSVSATQSISSFTKLGNAFKAYNRNLTKSTQLQNAYINAVGGQNKALGNYLAGLNGAKASMGGYIKSLIGAKAASIGLQAASLALNAAISMGLSLAISALISGISKWINMEKEARERAIETANTAKEESDNLTELLNKYNQLSEEVKTNTSAKDDLVDTQAELLKALGIEQSELDGLISKYGDLSTAINQVTLDSLKDKQADLLTGYNAQKEELLKVGKGYAHWYSVNNRNILNGGSDSTDVFNVLEKSGIISSGSYGSGGGSLVLTGDENTVEGVLENYERLKSAQEALNKAISDGVLDTEKISGNSLYKGINDRYKELQSIITSYTSSLADVNNGFANQEIYESLMGKELPKNAEEFEAFKQSLIDTAQESNNFIGTQEDIKASIINALAEMPEFTQYFEDLAKIQSSTLNNESQILSISDTITKLDTQLRPALDALKKSYQEIFTEDGFTLENVDISMLNNVLDVMNEIKETGLGIDTSGFENLAKVLTDSSSTAEQVQGAFDNLASTILNSTNITGNLTDETAALVTTLLEEMGVANAQEIVYASLNAQTEALALQKQFAAQTGHELVNATNDEVIAFLNHAGASEIARTYLFQLVAAEQVFNEQGLSVEDKIAKLKELATAYGQTAIAARIANIEKTNQDGHISIDYNKELASLQNEINGAINNVKVDFNGIGGGSKSAGKAGKEAADAYLEAFETELKKLDDLKSRGKQQLPLITVM